ncbi:MAG: YeeE/YedE family protein [Pseudohongiella sp.]|nr:YeeE/YedE family protein [Pseudohongiella sp.]MDP2127273.1 YeeE/YedE family protein [Pseudohongiella sp.]
MKRPALIGMMLTLIGACFAIAGPRSALLMTVGLGFGLVLEGLRFGFAGPWRAMLLERDCRGLIAQFMAIALCAVVMFPLLAQSPLELNGAHAPIGIAMIAAAFVFGVAMQVVMGCGSGVLVNAGSGNFNAMFALPGFIAGSFIGSLHLGWWTSLGSLPVYSLQSLLGSGAGLLVTLLGLCLLACFAVFRAAPGKRLPARRLWWAAALIATLAVLNLVIAGQPWGVVYGLGLWGAKVAQAGGMDLALSSAWSSPANAERLSQSLFTDVTSLTNIGLMVGALVIMQWRRAAAQGKSEAQVPTSKPGVWLVMLLAGVVLGYSARVAFGCNVGAYFSGISTGSLHGWVWFAAAFAGSALGIRLRNKLMHIGSTPESARGLPTRTTVSAAAMIVLVLLLWIDIRNAEAVNPFAAPWPTALGSGVVPSGAHCTDI